MITRIKAYATTSGGLKGCICKGKVLDFPLYSSISFDLTVTSIYTPLGNGKSNGHLFQ